MGGGDVAAGLGDLGSLSLRFSGMMISLLSVEEPIE